MNDQRRKRWLSRISEGVAIVASILLAFAIDAWWDNRSEREQAAELAASLHEDFEVSQAHVEQWLAGNRRILEALEMLLEAVESRPIGEEISVPMSVIVGSIGAPTYSPTDATLSAAISSGQIDLLRDYDLRNALALWLQQVDDTREDELLIRQITVDHLVPELASQVRLGRAFDFQTLTAQFLDLPTGDLSVPVTLRTTRGLEGALAERLFYTHFVVGGLSDIRDTQAEIIRLLELRLADR